MSCEQDDTLIINNINKYIINEKNVLISKKYIENMLKSFGIKYKINNIELFIEAMTHKSYLNSFMNNERNIKYLIQNIKLRNIKPNNGENILKLKDRCYERLEFLGDSVIRLVVAEYLYTRYPMQDEGFLTRLKTKIENGESLSRLSKILGFDKYIIISKHVDLNGARNEDDIGILGDVFEAFIGALYLDSKCLLDICKPFIIKLIEEKMDIAEMLFYETNYKDMLLKYFHKMKWQDPIYDTLNIKETGDTKKKIFTMCIKDNTDTIIGKGDGNSKKKGEQLAAKRALETYGELDNSSDESEIEIDSD